jgi:hypothetical protein
MMEVLERPEDKLWFVVVGAPLDKLVEVGAPSPSSVRRSARFSPAASCPSDLPSASTSGAIRFLPIPRS